MRRIVLQKAWIATLPLATLAGLVTGCAEMEAAQKAAAAVKTASETAQTIPATIQAVADAFAIKKGVNWGKPSAIVSTETQYVVVYPTPLAERKAGRARIIIVNKASNAAQFATPQVPS